MNRNPIMDSALMAKQQMIAGGLDRSSVADRLRMRRDELQQQLTDIDAALEALDASPEVSRAVEALSRIGGFHY